MKKKLVVLTGAGISAESGIKTFRDSDGLWEGHNVMDVATPEGWHKNPALVLDFYNQRRKQLKEVQPNLGHQILAELENEFDVFIITQNVDDLHEVPALDEAITLTQSADYFAVIGTSLQVYPAAGLIDFTSRETPIFYIDPKPIKIPNLRNPLDVIPEVASEGMKILKKKLLAFI
jgi:NAD-dependent deacetylase